jgi:uncharacterized protein (TIGR02145 family)
VNKFRFSKTANIVNSRGYTATFRKRIITRKRTIISVIAIVAALVIAPIGVHAVQNIFTGFGQITDIQFGGANIDKVVYQGETIWERDNITIQGISLVSCPTTPTPVRDARDGHYYSISMLADGNCWMLTNLAYGGDEAGIKFTTGTGQSDVTGDAPASASTWTKQTPPYNNQKQWLDPTNPDISQDSTGTRCAIAYRTTSSSIDYTECGYLYNWCAALGNSSPACGQNSGVVDGAGATVCPAGWRLPTRHEYSGMYAAIGNNHSELVGVSSAWRGVYSGRLEPGYGLRYQGSNGYYWSSSAANLVNGVNLSMYSNEAVNTSNSSEKWMGFAVRCVKAPYLQEITSATCPADRTRVRDARDGATYWVRKIGSLCWMETNLAYAGGGINIFGDVTPAIPMGSSATYTSPTYNVPTGSNRTTGTTDPSTSTTGTGQYGYLYNLCAAMNSQSTACQDSSATQPNQSVNGGTSSTLYNICPKNWRLPTGGSGGEFQSLASSLGWTSGAPTPLFNNGLFMYSGHLGSGSFYNQGSGGYYWSSTIDGAAGAYSLTFTTTNVLPVNSSNKQSGLAVRCVAP